MTDWTSVDASVTTPSFFAAGDYHALFKRLRADDPVHWTVGRAVRPYWSITRYADCVRVLEDAETFSSEHGPILPPTADEPTPEQRHAMGYGSVPTHTDPPRHLLVRRPFNKHWAAPAIARLRPKIAACIDAILSEVSARGECDLVEDVAAQLPARFVCELMGVPAEDRPRIRHYAAAFLGAHDPAYQIDGDETKTQRTMMKALFDYMSDLAGRRRGQPADDFTSIAASIEINAAPIDDRDLGWWCFAFVAAGLESTRNALAAGLFELMRQPGEAERLRADPALAPLAAEEIVRWVSPSKHKFRIAARDCEVGGKPIRAGDWVMAWLVSANRDETVFDHPDRFDIGRKPNPHIAFGAGEHSCIGRQLAKLEIQMMVLAILERLPDLRIAGDPVWFGSNNHTGLKRLTVKFKSTQLPPEPEIATRR